MNPLYFKDSYMKEFSATVQEVKDDKYIILDQTAFYPNSGGQQNDTGILIKDKKEYKVLYVGKFDRQISHEIEEPGLQPGDKVTGKINWERRYKLMRSHTAAHIVSAIIHKKMGAMITGNQLTEEKVRIDFNTENYDVELLKGLIEHANKIIALDLPLKTYYITRQEAENDPEFTKLAKGLPEGMQELRVVQIGDFDKQADGGTHVKSTKEIGKLEFLKADNKGKNNRRVYFKLS